MLHGACRGCRDACVAHVMSSLAITHDTAKRYARFCLRHVQHTHVCCVQGEAADLAVYLGQPQGSDPAWLMETLAGFVGSYDQAVQGLMSKVRPSPAVQQLNALSHVPSCLVLLRCRLQICHRVKAVF